MSKNEEVSNNVNAIITEVEKVNVHCEGINSMARDLEASVTYFHIDEKENTANSLPFVAEVAVDSSKTKEEIIAEFLNEDQAENKEQTENEEQTEKQE